MSSISEYDFVASEITELEQILKTLSVDRVLERYGLEIRLTRAQELLATLPPPKPTVCLTFRGKTVDGSRSISADFGAKALDAFTDVFSTVAVGSTIDLSARGRIPEKEKNLLRVVGTAIGSFGFELELPQETSGLFTSPEDTVQTIKALLEASANGSDDTLADIVSDLPSRAIKSLNSFLDVLIKNESWCGLSYGEKKFYYNDLKQVEKSVDRLAETNVRNGDKTFYGTFKGFLPKKRTFEFMPAPDGTEQNGIMHGKIDIAIDEPDILNHQWLNKPVIAKLHFVQIGHGKPRYTLKSLDDLSPQ